MHTKHKFRSREDKTCPCGRMSACFYCEGVFPLSPLPSLSGLTPLQQHKKHFVSAEGVLTGERGGRWRETELNWPGDHLHRRPRSRTRTAEAARRAEHRRAGDTGPTWTGSDTHGDTLW